MIKETFNARHIYKERGILEPKAPMFLKRCHQNAGWSRTAHKQRMTEIFWKDEVKKTTVCRCKSPYQRQSHNLFNSISAYEKSNLLDLLTFTESTEFNVAELFCSSNLGMYVWLDVVLIYFR